MKQLSESVTNIVTAAEREVVKPNTPQVGLTQTGGKMIIPCQPLTVETMRTARSAIESMIQRNSLTVSAVTRWANIPQRDDNGDIYAWEYGYVETGEYAATLVDPTDKEIAAIKNTIQPGHKRGIQSALERLAQIKPIGRSEVKQSTVIGYLSYDLFEEGISEFVVNELCKEYRQTEAITFFPDSAEFFHKAKRRMKKYHAIYQAQFPKPEPKALPEPEKTLKQKAVETQEMPWDGYTLETMPDDVKSCLIQFCKDFESHRIAEIYCRSYGIDYNQLVGGDI